MLSHGSAGRWSSRCRRGELQAGGDVDAAADGAGDRAAFGVEAEDPGVQFDLADRLGPQTTACGGEASCLKCSSEGACQSARGCGDQVVEGGGMRLLLVGGDAVVLGDGAVHAEQDRLIERGQDRAAKRALVPRDADLRTVYDLAHCASWM